VDILKESFKWVMVDMRKAVIFMFVVTFLFSSLEAFVISSVLNTAGNDASVVSQQAVFGVSAIQNAKVLILTSFLCFFVTKVISAGLGAWGQVKAQFHAFFFGMFIGLLMALMAGSLINFVFKEQSLEIQMLGIAILFGLFMIMGYWHYYIMYTVRRKMAQSGVKYGTAVMLRDSFSIFKHWKYVIGFAGMSMLIMVLAIAAGSTISILIENAYVSSLVQSAFYPFTAVALVWYAKSVYYHYAQP